MLSGALTHFCALKIVSHYWCFHVSELTGVHFTTICFSIYSKHEIIINILFGVLTVEKLLKLKNTFQTKCLYEVWRTGHAFCCHRGLLWALWPLGALLDFFLLGRGRPVKDYHHLFQAIVTVLQSYRFVCKMYIRLQ